MLSTIEFVLLDCDYSMVGQDDFPVIHLWGKQDQKRVEIRVEGFFPYFYVETDEKEVQGIIGTGNKELNSWVVRISEEKRTAYFGGKDFRSPCPAFNHHGLEVL